MIKRFRNYVTGAGNRSRIDLLECDGKFVKNFGGDQSVSVWEEYLRFLKGTL
jgi:hypothetical protein